MRLELCSQKTHYKTTTMKKIFTLLSVALLSALSMTAREVPQVESIEIRNPMDTQIKLAQLQSEIDLVKETGVSSERVYKRSCQVGTDTYNLLIANPNYKITDIFKITSNGHELTFEEIPLYIVEYCLTRTDINGNETAKVECMLAWPSYELFYDGISSDYSNDYSIVSVKDMANAKKIDERLCNTFTFYDENQYVWVPEGNLTKTYGIIGKLLEPKGVYSTINGEAKVMMAVPQAGRETTVQFMGFDARDMSISTDAHFYLETQQGRQLQLDCEYTGTYIEIGFDKQTINYELSNVHIFNCGEFNQDKLMGSANPFLFDFEPQQMFYIYMPGKYNDIEINANAKGFDPSQIALVWPQSTPEELRTFDNMHAMCGYMFAPLGSEITDGGRYEMQRSDVKKHPYDDPRIPECPFVYPQPYTLIPTGVRDESLSKVYEWSNKFGFLGIYQGRTWQWTNENNNPGYILMNTAKGLQLKAFTHYGDTYSAIYDRDIIYHFNPENINETKLIPSKGSFVDASVDGVGADENAAQVYANGSAVVVRTIAATDVKVYTLGGACVANCMVNGTATFPLDKGVYIVKAGNVARKVAL